MEIVREDGRPVPTQELLEELRDRIAREGELTHDQKVVLLDIIEFWKGFKWVAKSMKLIIAGIASIAVLATSWESIIKFLKN